MNIAYQYRMTVIPNLTQRQFISMSMFRRCMPNYSLWENIENLIIANLTADPPSDEACYQACVAAFIAAGIESSIPDPVAQEE